MLPFLMLLVDAVADAVVDAVVCAVVGAVMTSASKVFDDSLTHITNSAFSTVNAVNVVNVVNVVGSGAVTANADIGGIGEVACVVSGSRTSFVACTGVAPGARLAGVSTPSIVDSCRSRCKSSGSDSSRDNNISISSGVLQVAVGSAILATCQWFINGCCCCCGVLVAIDVHNLCGWIWQCFMSGCCFFSLRL